MTITNRTIAFALAGALVAGACATASAGPLPVNSGMKNAASDQVTDVRWRGRGGGWGWGPGIGIGAGIAAGALIGSAVAAQPYGYYGDPGYAYAQPYAVEPGYAYAQPYAYDAGPTYVAPGYYGTYGYRSRGQCFTDEGYGRRTPCDASGR